MELSQTTGNEHVDKLVAGYFTEAIGLAYQVITDKAPLLDQELRDNMAVHVVVNVWRPLAMLVIEGTQAVGEERFHAITHDDKGPESAGEG